MPDDVLVFDRLLEIALLVQADMARELEPVGLTPARTHLLWEVHHRGPSSQRTLATALDVSARNVTGLVDALEESGFVHREAHPTDRRVTLVTLTELGARTTTEMETSHRQIAAQLLAGFDAERLARLRTDLDTIAGRLHELMDVAGRS